MAMKTMVVDDEIVSLKKMEKILTSLGPCDAFRTGAEAVEAFRAAHQAGAPYDLMTLDVNMPSMNGTEVLQQVRDFEKQAEASRHLNVLMVTSHADQQTVVTCLLANCDGYLVKPFNAETVMAKVLKAMDADQGRLHSAQAATPARMADGRLEKGGLAEMIRDRFSRDRYDLPVMPRLGGQLRLAAAGEGPIAAMANLIKTDLAMSSELIRIANSPVFRGARETWTVEQAICRMGLQATCQYVEAIAGRSVYQSIPKKLFHLVAPIWRHSLACAHVCRFTADILTECFREDPFLLGLVHDIGKLVFVRIYSDLYRQGKLNALVSAEQLAEEMEQCHCNFGEALLQRWGFGPTFAMAARYHHDVAAAPETTTELIVVAFADELVTHLETTAAGTSWCADNSPAARRLQLNGLVVDALFAQAADTMAQLDQVLSL